MFTTQRPIAWTHRFKRVRQEKTYKSYFFFNLKRNIIVNIGWFPTKRKWHALNYKKKNWSLKNVWHPIIKSYLFLSTCLYVSKWSGTYIYQSFISKSLAIDFAVLHSCRCNLIWKYLFTVFCKSKGLNKILSDDKKF